jgi:hypothetical protein
MEIDTWGLILGARLSAAFVRSIERTNESMNEVAEF